MIRSIYIGKTNARQYRGCLKIGIATDTDKRWNDIDRSVKGSKEWPVMSGIVIGAKRSEKRLHRKYAKYRVRFKGSGKTEWFKMPVLIRWKLVADVMWLVFRTWLILGLFTYCLLYAIFVRLEDLITLFMGL